MMMTNSPTAPQPRREDASQDEAGYALLIVITLMVPLIITAAAFSSVMRSRGDTLRVDQDALGAQMMAETGIDFALYRARNATLLSTGTYTYSYGTKQYFRVVPKDLFTDLVDNDGDGAVDAADPDEDVTQIVVSAFYRKATHRIAAYIGPMPLLPGTGSAVTLLDPAVRVTLTAGCLISGTDTDMTGGPGTESPIYGISTDLPSSTTHLSAELTGAEPAVVTGTGMAPSLGMHTAPDLEAFDRRVRNVADRVLTSGHYQDLQFGNGSSGEMTFTHRTGNLTLEGATRGAGVLVVTGDLALGGSFRFDGLILVFGQITQATGTSKIYGAVIQGDKGGAITAVGDLQVHYSSAALALANSRSGRFVLFNGWQVID